MNKIVAVLMLIWKERKKIHLALIYCKPDIFNENVNVLSEFESFKWALSGLSQLGMIL